MACRDVVKKYGIKYFYDITDRSDFRANPDYKGVCHVALAQEGHCKPGDMPASLLGFWHSTHGTAAKMVLKTYKTDQHWLMHDCMVLVSRQLLERFSGATLGKSR